jgi:glucosamine--fructose-6-phosphate aminotransferase (isomerizing)
MELDSLNMRGNILSQGESVIESIERSKENIEEIAKLVFDCKRFLVCGAGDKYLIPLISKFIWKRFSKAPLEVVHSRTFADYYAEQLDERTCVILLSQSGLTKDTLDAMNLAIKRSAFCIGITNLKEERKGSLWDLERYAKGFVINSYTKIYPEEPVPSTSTFHAMLALLNLLFLYICRAMQADVEEYIEKQEKEIPKVIDELSKSEELITWAKEKALVLKRFAGESFYVLGDGPRYPIARKQALIQFMEGAKQDACAIELEEFIHSLIATLEEANPSKKPFILLKPRDSFLSPFTFRMLHHIESLLELKLRERFLRVDPFQFTTYRLEKEIGSLLTPPLYIIPLEWLTYHFAIERGIDPGVCTLVEKIRGEEGLRF